MPQKTFKSDRNSWNFNSAKAGRFFTVFGGSSFLEKDDPERPTFKENHLLFYYNKCAKKRAPDVCQAAISKNGHRYFRRQLSLKSFGVESVAELLDLVKDCVGNLDLIGFLKIYVPPE